MSTAHSRLRVYMSGPLSGLPPETKEVLVARYELIQEICEDDHYSCYCPHQHSDPDRDASLTPAEVHRMDSTNVRDAELLIAECSVPALGVGIECQMANEQGIPILIVAQQRAVVSRLVRGLPNVLKAAGDADIVRFNNDLDLRHGLRHRLQDLKGFLMARKQQRGAEVISIEALRQYSREKGITHTRYERLQSVVAAAVAGRFPRTVEDWAALDNELS